MNLFLSSLIVSKLTFIVEKYMALLKNHITHPKGAAAGAGLYSGAGGVFYLIFFWRVGGKSWV